MTEKHRPRLKFIDSLTSYNVAEEENFCRWRSMCLKDIRADYLSSGYSTETWFLWPDHFPPAKRPTKITYCVIWYLRRRSLFWDFFGAFFFLFKHFKGWNLLGSNRWLVSEFLLQKKKIDSGGKIRSHWGDFLRGWHCDISRTATKPVCCSKCLLLLNCKLLSISQRNI